MTIYCFDFPILNIRSGTISNKNITNGKCLAHKHSHKKNYNRNVIFHNLYMSKNVQ